MLHAVLRILSTIVITITFLGVAISQSPFHTVEMKENTSFTSETINGVAQIVIDYPSNGSYSFQSVSGGFVLNYTPDSGFVGKDTIIIEYMGSGNNSGIEYDVFFFDVRPTLIYLSDDYFTVDKNSDYQFLDVLSNDEGTDEPFSLDQTLHISNGYSYISDDSLFFKPNSGFEGIASVSYRACDSLDYCDKAQAKIYVVDSSNIANQDTLELFTPENTELYFVLPDTAFESTSGPDLGVVSDELNGMVFSYSPFQNTNGDDEIIMDNGEITRVVIIHIIDIPTVNQRVVDDYVYTHVDQEVEFNVLDNDFISSGYVNSYTQPSDGTVEKLSGGNFKFTPDADFDGLTQFSYTTCLFGANCETGKVKLFVGNLNPNNRSNYELITPKNRDLVINYEVPISNFMFEVVQDCSNGELTVYPGFDTLSIGCEEVSGHNLVVYSPDSGYVGEDEFDLEYCVNGGADCEIVKVKVDVLDKELDSVCVCADDCVWPGDINHDGKVDMVDLLSLGWNVGMEGEERPYAEPEEWYGQYAPNWDVLEENAYNLKHADVDGDGFVGISDTLGIDNFYNKIHSILADPIKEPREYPIMLEIESPQDPEPGDYVLLNVYAGTENDPAYDLHGLNLHFDFHPDIVDTSSIEMFFTQSSWLASNDAGINLVKHQGRSIDGALSRIDQRGRAGYGIVAQVGFIVEDDLDGIRAEDNILTYSIGLTESSIMLGDGSLAHIENVYIPLRLRLDGRKTENLNDDDVLVYPNPSSDVINVRSNTLPLTHFTAYDMMGRVVYDAQSDAPRQHSRLNVAQWSPGLYILEMSSENGQLVSKKVQVID